MHPQLWKGKLLLILTLAASMFLVSMATAHAEEVPTFKAKVGELKKITFKLTNNQSKQQQYWYIIQVKNEEGFTDQLSWVNSLLEPSEEFTPQQSWIPEKPGEYIIEIFVTSCIDCPGALMTPLVMKVIVEP